MTNKQEPSVNEIKLRALNAQLLTQNEQLTKQLDLSTQALSASESRIAQLLLIVSAHEESLQKIGENWYTPARIDSLTFESSVGVCVDGIPIRATEVVLPDDQTAKFMADLAAQINRAKRLR